MFIQGELTVDDFLTNDDRRYMGEDLTDRFDHTFLFGDLNFRLDISRLHADWLISRRDYAQALGFDQLRNLMQHGDAFVGFNEADINFPPTFKYDVMRILKRLKPKSSRSAKRDSALSENPLVEEPEVHVDDVDGVENGDGDGDNDDAGSLASSNTASINYRLPPGREPVEDGYLSRTHALRASTGNLVQKVKTMAAAQKPKTKLPTRLSPLPPSLIPNNKSISSPMLSLGHSKWSDEFKKSSREDLNEQKTPALPSKIVSATPPTLDTSSTRSSTISKSVDRSLLGPPPSRTDLSRSTSDEEVDEGRGVYDSSSKKRVPSWLVALHISMSVTQRICALRCDRILWKSTVEPDPDSDDDESEALHPKAKTRVGQFFANFKMRYRKSSHSSSTSSEAPNYDHAPSVPSRDEVFTPSHSVHGFPISTLVGGKDLIPFSRFVTPEDSGPESTSPSSIDNINAANVRQTLGVGLLRSFSVDQTQSEGKSLSKYREPSRAGTAPTKPRPVSAIPPPTEPVPTVTTPKDDQVARNGLPKWRFLPFLRGDSGQTTATADPSLTPEESMEMIGSPTTHRPRKGDVVCLGYDSLDDKAMRRLEGRSDHRPVVGSFAIYL